MPFTVTPANGTTKDADYQEYLRLLSRILLQQEINLADVPRVAEPGTGKRWLYVWPTAQEAQDFAHRLQEQIQSPEWVVQEVDATPSRGPLRPLEIQVGRRRDGWTFALAPWARKAIQTQFPGSCLSSRVFIASDGRGDLVTAQGGLDRLARQMLLVLTGLNTDQLQAFGSFVVTDPVSGEALLSPTPIQPFGQAE